MLVTGIQPAQVLELKESLDPTDVGSPDARHKGEHDGEWGAAFVKQPASVPVISLHRQCQALCCQSTAWGEAMTTIIIKDLPDATYRALEKQAA
ncbi:hypothetical protein ASG68_21795 [Rhizobium sp. Leaf453]|nr:hypothetical protein ASG50_11150 [Rhizobium sp. Leaf386]KQT05007.1 hypothetical protein ASG42_22840 [Rhizobium sp. Leaf391]KQU08808.1 hypothetical protein ASG68_21795 [Rhizobium sp. Leaf453]